MALLLIEDAMVDDLGAPLLGVLIPNLLALTNLLLLLDLDPLKHFDAPYNSERLLHGNSKVDILHRAVGIILSNAVNEFEVSAMLLFSRSDWNERYALLLASR